jgi:energy-coupling factor transport system permease protein
VILPTPLTVDDRAPLARANPLAKLGAAAIIMLALFAAVDPLTPAVVLVAVAGMVPATGLRASQILLRAWPLIVAAVAIGVFNALLAPAPSGSPVSFGPVTVGTGNLRDGAGLGLRILGIALAGVIAFASIEPIELADALVQQLHTSPRFAIGALAAVRLLPILAHEWWILGLARRARGVDAGRSPFAWARLTAGRLFALLVAGIRRATRLSLAMDARGFDAGVTRTAARPMHMGRRDWLLLGGAATVGALATAVSVVAGSYRFILA